MRNNRKNLYLLLALLVAVVSLGFGIRAFSDPVDVTIDGPRTFAALDASDGATDGTFNVFGNLIILNGGKIQSYGADIKIVVGGTFTMMGPAGGKAGALISSRGSGVAGDIDIAVTGYIDMKDGSEVNASAGGYSAGAIVITSLDNAYIDGHVFSVSGLSGSGARQAPGGGPITIKAVELRINDTGIVRSLGGDPGADLVHLEACNVTIYGLVESTGKGHGIPSNPPNHLNPAYRPGKPANSAAGVEIWAGTILIDKTGTHKGEINANLQGGGGTQGTSWIDLFAAGDITIIGAKSGNFAVHANENMGSGGLGSQGGVVTTKSVKGKIAASGLAFQADGISGGGDGGQIIIEALSDVMLDDAQIFARGDSAAMGGYGDGGKINIRSFHSFMSWQDTAIGPIATGDVQPTGSGVLQIPRPGAITFQKCLYVDTTGTVFPFTAGVFTPPTVLGDYCFDAPLLPVYVVLPDCGGPGGD